MSYKQLRITGYLKERIITSPQGAEITIATWNRSEFCSNNYLGLSSHPEVVQGPRMPSTHMDLNVFVRFI
jgi:7-keto-8-aminopelargonate synthetase-like enzyme